VLAPHRHPTGDCLIDACSVLLPFLE